MGRVLNEQRPEGELCGSASTGTGVGRQAEQNVLGIESMRHTGLRRGRGFLTLACSVSPESTAVTETE